MRCPLLVCSALAIGAVVCFGSDAHARERPVFCDPPTVTVVARGAIVGGKRLTPERIEASLTAYSFVPEERPIHAALLLAIQTLPSAPARSLIAWRQAKLASG